MEGELTEEINPDGLEIGKIIYGEDTYGDDIEVGVPISDTIDFIDLPRHPCLLNCPLCGHLGETKISKDKFELALATLIYCLKILLALAMTAVVILMCLLMLMMIFCNDNSSQNDCGNFLTWYCILWDPNPHNSTCDCCFFCNFTFSSVRTYHHCRGCKQRIGCSQK